MSSNDTVPRAPLQYGTLSLWLYGAVSSVMLVLQVAWARQLISTVGSTLGSVSVMFAVLMGGFALGAWLDRRLSDRTRRPSRSLAVLYVCAGASAFLTLFADRMVSLSAISRTFPNMSPNGAALVGLALTIPILLLPVIFAGAAFPVLTRYIMSEGISLRGFSRVLFAQTAGSVIGALASGFLLLERLGIDMTIGLASAVCVLAGGLSFLLKESASAAVVEPTSITQDEDVVTERHTEIRRTALTILALSGAATFIYEVAWARELLLLFGSSVYANSVMLASVLLGLGLGQWLGSKRIGGANAGLVRVTSTFVLAAAFGLLSVSLMRLIPVAYVFAYNRLPANLALVSLIQAALVITVIIAPATLIGFASPTLMRLAAVSLAKRGEQAGVAYAVNTVGGLVGSLVAGFVLLPLITAKGAVSAAAALQVIAAAVAFTTLHRRGNTVPHVKRLAAVLAACLVAFLLADARSPLLNFVLTKDDFDGSALEALRDKQQKRPVYFRDASQGRVAVFQVSDGRYLLKGSGMTEGGEGFIDDQTMNFIAHLPEAFPNDAKEYLVIGLGTGTTSKAALALEGVERVDTVELNPAMVAASRYFVGDSLLLDPRSNLEITDARTYLAVGSQMYDAIISEPSYPLSPFSAQLFTRESFELMRGRLRPGGVMCQWIPAYLLGDTDKDLILKTFSDVFPNSYVWTTQVGDNAIVDIIIVGVNDDEAVDFEAVDAALRAGQAARFNFSYRFGTERLEAIRGDSTVPFNTDDKPLLEYRTPLRQIEALWQ